MKKKNIYIIIITTIAIVLLFIVLLLLLDRINNRSIIPEEEALSIALQEANLTREEVTITSTNRDHDDRKYEIEFFDQNYEYDIEVDMVTGRIIKIEKDVRNGNIIENNSSSDQITLDEAKEVAINYLNLNQNEVTFTKSKLDFEHGTLIYELEFYASDMSYEMDINAYNKEIVRIEKDNLNHNNLSEESDRYIGSSKAKEIALNHAKIDGNVIWERTEFDFDNRVAVYEVEFYYNNQEYNYEINAVDGSVIKYEIDRESW